MIEVSILSKHNNPELLKRIDRFASIKLFQDIDDIKEYLYNQTCNIIIIDESFIQRILITEIKNITMGKVKIIGILQYENIHKCQFGLDDFLISPINPVITEYKIKLLANTIDTQIVPNHFFDNEIIFECIDKLNRMHMTVELQMPQSHVDFLIKNIEWNLRLIEIFHVSIKINIPFFQMLILLTKNLMKYFSTSIEINIQDDITMISKEILREIIIKTIGICRFGTRYEKVSIEIKDNKIYTNVIKKFSNTFSSRLLKFILEQFKTIEICFDHKIN